MGIIYSRAAIRYNILNLPQDTITRLTSSTKLTTDYCGDIIYQNDSLKEILTPEGYWQNEIYYYYLKDHQGNTRIVLNQNNVQVEISHYYPDGMRFESSTSNSAALPYRYNGKELESMNGLNEYDYGARRRETGIPVWTAMDPLAEKYYSVSPYVYCSDNSINAIDTRGKLVIFINGNHYGDGGTSKYWNDFDTKVMNWEQDYKFVYKDGSLGGWAPFNMPSATRRDESGYAQGQNDAPSIILELSKNSKGEIIETIKVIAHSMGAAFAKGYIRAILEYAHKMGITDPFIAFEADFAPFEPTKQKVVKDPLMGPTYQFTNTHDHIANNWILGSPSGQEQGAPQTIYNDDPSKGHQIVDFYNQIKTLPTGKYKVINGQIIPIN